MPTPALPVGVRNQNLGNLVTWRDAFGARPTKDGFALFDSFEAGLHAYFINMAIYYNQHGYKTLAQFIGAYAPPTENDLAAYLRKMCLGLNINPLYVSSVDLELNNAWRALDFARTQINIEQGSPPRDWPGYPYWFRPSVAAGVMSKIKNWMGEA
jgi:hypothetical protein